MVWEIILRPQHVKKSKYCLPGKDFADFLLQLNHKKNENKKNREFMPAAISLQSSVGRYLMNYLLSEVMFTSLYIYWDSPPFSFCLRRANSDSKLQRVVVVLVSKRKKTTVKYIVTRFGVLI